MAIVTTPILNIPKTITLTEAKQLDGGTILKCITGGSFNCNAGEYIITTRDTETPFITLATGWLWGNDDTDQNANGTQPLYSFEIIDYSLTLTNNKP